MTTKPKAKKFRIRRSTPLIEPSQPVDRAPSAADYQQAAHAHAQQQAAQQQRRIAPGHPTPPQEQPATQPQASAPASVGAQIDAIRKEGLTGRQLRMARRLAQKHGLPATSDFDAVRLLRASGIDPFERESMLQLMVDNQQAQDGGGDKPADQRQTLPQTVPMQTQGLPSPHMAPGSNRVSEIARIQQDIAARRRRKLVLLLARLSAFVVLPTIIAAYYFYAVATPMYATNSEFVVQQSEGQSAGGFGAFLPSQLNTNQDSVAIQNYITSKEAMLRLDADVGFKAHFQQDWIDPIQRLDVDATNEDAYKYYKKYVKIGYDPSEGIMRMEVVAADPVMAQRFAEALIRYAEERADSLTRRKREDQLSVAQENLAEAEARRREAQVALVDLQQQAIVVDPEAVLASIRGQINQREIELQEKKLQLTALLDNPRPNQSRVAGVQADIGRLEAVIEELNARMTASTTGADSLTELSSKVKLAEADLATRDMMLQSALQNMETATLEASRQTRYLSRNVDPIVPDAATYPRKFENTILTFLIFSGIYLMISLTASILREQVSS
jgi:capsular polysaccharide transport system permease protein